MAGRAARGSACSLSSGCALSACTRVYAGNEQSQTGNWSRDARAHQRVAQRIEYQGTAALIKSEEHRRRVELEELHAAVLVGP
jgi:hypothetical protein